LTLRAEQLRETVVDLFLPPRFVGFGKAGKFLCDFCLHRLPRIFPPVCIRCCRPESTATYCPSCWGLQSHIDGIRSPFRFDGVIRKAIHELKYHNLRAMAGQLAALLAQYLASATLPGDLLVPVPLHDQRLRERGYNQSALIARELRKLVLLPVAEGCLCRIKNSLPQARTTNVDQRLSNVVDAFSCIDQRLNGKRIILIDDVCTSGATLEACAVALKSAGAVSVWGLTLARDT
jgi:ComF family protein